MPKKEAPPDDGFRRANRILLWLAGLLLLSLVLYGMGQGWPGAVQVIGLGIGVGLAAAAAGALVGLLFGIPVRGAQEIEGAQEPGGGNQASINTRLPYRGNTSLEQISDWLVKILVGVGLVQLGAAPSSIAKLTTAVGDRLGSESSADLVAGALIIVGTVSGFFFSYIFSRRFLPRLLSTSEAVELERRLEQSIEDSIADLEHKIDEQADRDARARDLTEIMIVRPAGVPAVGQEELEAALVAASADTSAEIRARAAEERRKLRDFRRTRPLTEAERAQWDSLVLLLEALAVANPSSHRNNAQLAFALMESDPPRLADAAELLTTAIRTRPRDSKSETAYYDWNRAACRIQLAAASDHKISPGERAAIIADLETAIHESPELEKRTAGDERLFSRDSDKVVAEWLKHEGLYESLLGRLPDAGAADAPSEQ